MYEDALVTLNKDKKLKKIISYVGECKIRTISNPFEALIEAIITQQISDSVGKAIFLRFKNLFGTKYPTANDVFKLSKTEIKSIGLSSTTPCFSIQIPFLFGWIRTIYDYICLIQITKVFFDNKSN